MIRKLFPIIFLIVISCSNKIISLKSDCDFPKSNLVPGWGYHLGFILKEALKDKIECGP